MERNREYNKKVSYAFGILSEATLICISGYIIGMYANKFLGWVITVTGLVYIIYRINHQKI
jgi:hypothetical protein